MFFVSHDPLHDEPLASAFLELLTAGLGVGPSDLFRAAGGFGRNAKSALASSTCIIALVTESFWADPSCVAALGVGWYASDKRLLAILIPPVSYDDLHGVVDRAEAILATSGPDLDRMRDALASGPTPKWREKRDAFLADLPRVLGACTGGRTAIAAYKKRCLAAEEALGRIKELVDALPATTGPSTAEEHFLALVDTAQAAIGPLPNIVVEALYYWSRGEEYVVSPYDSGDAEGAADEGYLKAGDRGMLVNERHPSVRRATEALHAVRIWLESPPPAFAAWYEIEAPGEEASLKHRPFWRRHLGCYHW